MSLTKPPEKCRIRRFKERLHYLLRMHGERYSRGMKLTEGEFQFLSGIIWAMHIYRPYDINEKETIISYVFLLKGESKS